MNTVVILLTLYVSS